LDRPQQLQPPCRPPPQHRIVDFDDVAGTTALTGNATMQGLRLRTTASSQVLNSGAFAITLGASAGADQGAGLQLVHTARIKNTVTHPVNIAFSGAQEGLIYAAGTARHHLDGYCPQRCDLREPTASHASATASCA